MAGRQVQLVLRDPAEAEAVAAARINVRHLPGQQLHDSIHPTATATAADFVILAVPAQATRTLLTALPPDLLAGKPVVLSAKGLETGTLLRQSEILRDMAPEAVPFVLSGPSF